MEQKKSSVYTISITAVMTAIICIVAPVSIPVGAIPISFTNFVIFLSVYLLGCKNGCISVAVYILMGLIGLPVFSGFSGGVGVLAGPTGGYIIGYLPMAVIVGKAVERWEKKGIQFLAMCTGCAVCYVVGTLWFCVLMKAKVLTALSVCVFPFIPGDLVKIVLAIQVGTKMKKQMLRAGI